MSAAPNRRTILKGLGFAAATCPFAAHAAPQRSETGSRAPVTDAPISGTTGLADRISPFGRNQAGIVTPRPANGMIASFDVIAQSPADLEDLFRRLTARIVALTQGGPVPVLDPKLPPADSGLLGPELMPDALTITVALGHSLFADRDWLAPLTPQRLQRMGQFPNDALVAANCHGDLSLQICANTADTTIHALRDILKTLPDRLILCWKQEGSVPVIPARPDGRSESARNFLGFRDGSANPDAGDAALMDELVWIGGDEPEWAHGGSYQAVRIIRNFVERWDRTPLIEQERVIGRTKMTGAPLDAPDSDESAAPDLAADPDGRLTDLEAHIRLANPRTADTQRSLILRRPFNYSGGVTKSGQLEQGLLFICYQSDLQQGFIAVQERLNGEPLEEYIKPVGGGYFVALPGITDPADFLGSKLIGQLART
ncbi:MAG: deferrochelatase/peroxidase EfeB [Paracoccus denitrificans]|nr:MAG: deferrochelatase/peroxidase EfeB [Paracoccus denitrificans]PZO85494.1 MAG: deferrochelatase/peroxidase EfeB [Paracoccus denitrificans]